MSGHKVPDIRIIAPSMHFAQISTVEVNPVTHLKQLNMWPG